MWRVVCRACRCRPSSANDPASGSEHALLEATTLRWTLEVLELKVPLHQGNLASQRSRRIVVLQGRGETVNGQGEAANGHGSPVHQPWQDWQQLDAAAATAWLRQALEACDRLAPEAYFPAGQPLLRTVQQRRGQGTDGQTAAQAAHAGQPTARSWEGALKALLVEWAGTGRPGATAVAAVLGLLRSGIDVQGEVRPVRGVPAWGIAHLLGRCTSFGALHIFWGVAHHGQALMQLLAADSTGFCTFLKSS